jgi:molecular chaperone DnaJ
MKLDLRRLDTCKTCDASGAQDGKAERCTKCGGRGQVAQVQRTPFGVMQRIGACPDCRGQGERIANPCRDCRGEGRTPQNVQLEVQVPPGVKDGTRLRLAGEGEAGPRGGLHGDLLLEVHVRKHPDYERRGDDLIAPLFVSMPRAALGGNIPFEHLDGQIDVEVPAGTQSGARIKIDGRGMPRMGGRGRGDLHLVVQVVTPKNLNPRSRKLMEELAEELGEAPQESARKKRFMDRVVDAFKQE